MSFSPIATYVLSEYQISGKKIKLSMCINVCKLGTPWTENVIGTEK